MLVTTTTTVTSEQERELSTRFEVLSGQFARPRRTSGATGHPCAAAVLVTTISIETFEQERELSTRAEVLSGQFARRIARRQSFRGRRAHYDDFQP